MPYPLRVHVDGAVYHVTARGNNRAPIFCDAADYQQYALFLGRYKTRLRFTLHAYALMPNHLHLLLQPSGDVTLSNIMQCLTIVYTKYFNRRYDRVGHVFQGRFHSKAITDDRYFLVASRYIHLNPVRAKLVSSPLHYPWSSYRAYCHPSDASAALVATDLVLALTSPEQERQRSAYRDFVEQTDSQTVHRSEADVDLLGI